MKYAWCVALSDESSQSGIVDSFEDAIKTIKAWYGDGGQEPDIFYSITPVNKA